MTLSSSFPSSNPKRKEKEKGRKVEINK